MTKEETVKIMAMLGAFYSGGKNDPRMQAQAWHLILQKYEYIDAEAAVLRFAENDTRDYATFPSVGKIVEAIREETKVREKPIKEVLRCVTYGKSYGELDIEARKLISADEYNTWLNIDPMVFAENLRNYERILRNRFGEAGFILLTEKSQEGTHND